MTDIFLTNSATRAKDRFTPIDADNVRIYVCGPTVYDRAHLGNARPVVVFDVLYRLLAHVYGPDHVTYVRNITDVEDKIIDRAAERGISIDDLTSTTTAWFYEDMAALGVDYSQDSRFHAPHATDYIPQMVEMIAELVERGNAYAAEGHVLFSVESYDDYGALSGRSVDDMIAGARVEVAPYKKNPMDFVLWKPSSADQPGWDSPWGKGRPGWHIECSAMSRALLGETFDIHGGGNDLTFPHHENEIAQSKCACPNSGFAKVWLHNEMLQVEGKKMSKSLGNFFTVRDLLDQGVPGEVIRFVFLSTHYRKPMDWTEKKAQEAEATLRRWRRELTGVSPDASPHKSVVDAIADDLNVAQAMAEMRKLFLRWMNAKSVNSNCSPYESEFLASAQFLGLLLPELGDWFIKSFDFSEFENLLGQLRDTAFATKDFTAVDAMKAALIEAGVEVRMSKAGVELAPAPGFDPAKLEGLL